MKEYDKDRADLLEILFEALRDREFPYLEEQNRTETSFRNFAFFESYFSNYSIRLHKAPGFDDAVEEMRTGISHHKMGDPHSFLPTFRIVSDRQEMSRTPHSGEELLEILKHRHNILLAESKDLFPGEFKKRSNHVIGYRFVDQRLVEGTLLKGFEYYKALSEPFARALFMHFLVSEIHPFLDGNGRSSRIMMNAELVSTGQSRILIPTVFREMYANALQSLSKDKDPLPLIDAFSRVRRFSSNIVCEDIAATREYLQQRNAFIEFRDLIKAAKDMVDIKK